jgi:hypothetical protein
MCQSRLKSKQARPLTWNANRIQQLIVTVMHRPQFDPQFAGKQPPVEVKQVQVAPAEWLQLLHYSHNSIEHINTQSRVVRE